MARLATLTLAATALLLAACSESAPTAPRRDVAWHFPGPDAQWERARPVEAGLDSVALESALDWMGTQASGAVVVVWRGRVVAERYWLGWDSSTRGPFFSAGKTITSALVLDQIAQGRFGLDDAVRTLLGNGWSRSSDTESAITVRHLLSMASGLNDSLQRIVAPGTRFYYNNPAYYQLFAVLEAASGSTFPTLLSTRVLTPIGMSRTLAIANTDTGEPGYIMAGSARDFARFGILMLNHGRWGGTQVLADSARLLTARSYSGTDNQSYGWLWWLNSGATYRTPGPYLLPTNDGALIPTAPSDLVAALGKDDKKLYLVPSRDLVVVRLGDRAPISGDASPDAMSSFDTEVWQRLSAAFVR